MAIRIHLRSELSDGQLSVVETEPAPGVGPPFITTSSTRPSTSSKAN
jgi:hypothetical protein